MTRSHRSSATVSSARLAAADESFERAAARSGAESRELRRRAGISQAAVARAIGVSRSVICELEAGRPSVSLSVRARAAAVVGGELRLPVFAGGPRLLRDATQARIVDRLLAIRDPRWRTTVEFPIPGPGRRSADLCLDSSRDRVLVEVESRLLSLEAIVREQHLKRDAVAQRSPPDMRIHTALVLPPTRANRAVVEQHPNVIRASYPASGTAAMRALRTASGSWPGDAIIWLSGRP